MLRTVTAHIYNFWWRSPTHTACNHTTRSAERDIDSAHSRTPTRMHSPSNTDKILALYRLSSTARAKRDSQCITARPRSERIAWLHTPKCGSSFGTTLLHFANSSLPDAARLPSCAHDGRLLTPEVPREHWRCVHGTPGNCTRRDGEKCVYGQPELTFFQHWPLDEHFRCIFWEKSRGNVGGHEPIDAATYGAFRGRFFGMFRRPGTRIASAYLWYASEFGPQHNSTLPSAAEYARLARGTTVRMLAGQADGEACQSGWYYNARCDASIVPNVPLALERLRDGFAFAGLTHAWAASICLFHAMFGGKCLGVEFENTRPTTPRTTRLPWLKIESNFTQRVAAEVAAVADPWDDALLDVVERRFWAEFKRRGLSARACDALCPAAPRGAFRSLEVVEHHSVST